MIDGKTVLAVIPARGGSKGIPRKNIIDVAGKPLIAWTIIAAQKSEYIDRLILSSDDDEITAVAKMWGCEVPFKRPAHLAVDDTPGIDSVIHAMDMVPDYDYVVVLQPTSPLRNVEDIDGCIEYCIKKNAHVCVSVTEPEKSPYWMFNMNQQGILEPVVKTKQMIPRRQDLPTAYALNGAVYVAESNWLHKNKSFLTDETLGFTMPKERSIDIDHEIDLQFARLLLEVNSEK